MDPEERAKALASISETHRHAFDERRSYEWKVVTAVITIDVLAVAARYAGKLSFDTNAIAIVVVAMSALLLGLVSIGYLRHMHEKNELNKRLYHAAENELINLIASKQLSAALYDVQNAPTANPNWSRNWEFAIIFLFGASAVLLIIAK